eukprot:gene13832-15278_t
MSHASYQSTQLHSDRRSSGDLQQDTKDMNGDDDNLKNQTRRNYKLLIDPAIKKGHHKIYRYEGALRGQPPVVPRDPRPPKAKLWTASVAELQVPQFKVDKNYVGALPENTIRFGCLNDNVNRQFLRELCSRFGKIEECKVYYDVKSKRHLGTGKITFTTSSAARQAVSDLDGSSVMGNIIRVSIDRKKPAHATHGNRPPGSKDPREYRRPSVGSMQTVLPTPPPSQYSPSFNSTPPTPLISALSRTHPVADMKSTSYLRRGSSLESDMTLTGSPTSICSASMNSGAFEAVSPSPGSCLFPPESEGKGPLPPPPPPAPLSDKKRTVSQIQPDKQQGIYEDISPTASFDEEKSSSLDSSVNETFVQAHLLGLSFSSTGELAKDNSKSAKDVKKTSQASVADEKHAPHSASSGSSQYRPSYSDRKRDYRDKRDYRSPSYDESRYKGSLGRDDNYHKDRRNGSPYHSSRERSLSGSSPYRKGEHPRSNSPYASSRDSHRSSSPYHHHRSSGYSRQRSRGRSRSPHRRNNSVERRSPSPAVKKPVDAFSIERPAVKEEYSSTKVEFEGGLATQPVYEEISDSDDEGIANNVSSNDPSVVTSKKLQVEDISPAVSPVANGIAVSLPTVETLPTVDQAALKTIAGTSQVSNEATLEVAAVKDDDDDDDAMSLSSISSNEESTLVLNTPATQMQMSVAPPHPVVAVSAYQQLNYTAALPQFVPQGPPINVLPTVGPQQVNIPPPAPVNVAIPPPMNVPPPPVSVQQNPMLPPLPPRPPVNIHVPPPAISFNKHIPPPFAAQHPPAPPSQHHPHGQHHPPGQHPPYDQHPAYDQHTPPLGQQHPPHGQHPSQLRPAQPPTYPQRPGSGGFINSFPRQYSGFYPGFTKFNPHSRDSHAPAPPRVVPFEEKVKNQSTAKIKKDLKPVLHRDFIKRLVEHSGFTALDAWWDNQIKSKENTSAATRLTTLKNNNSYVSPLTPSNISSPSNSTATSSLLSSLFGHGSSAAGIQSHGSMPKIPSFKISRKPQARPILREQNNRRLKRANERKQHDVTNKMQRSGSSLYRSIYESDSENDVSDDEEEEEDEKSEDEEKSEGSEDEDEKSELSEEEDDEEETRRATEKILRGVHKEKEEDDEEEESSEEEDSDSQWESSEAEEPEQEVIAEAKETLHPFKEKVTKRKTQDDAKRQHDALVEEYLRKMSHKEQKAKSSLSERASSKQKSSTLQQRTMVERGDNNHGLQGYVNKKLKANELIIGDKICRKDVVIEKTESVIEEIYEDENEATGEDGPIIEEFIEKVEEEIEESSVESKEELISEEVIKVEAEDSKMQEEVFSEHCYASFAMPVDEGKAEREKKSTQKDRHSPFIDVVDVAEDKLAHELLQAVPAPPKPVFPMRSIEDENSIVWDILNRGVDSEDLKYFKSAFESLQLLGSDVVNGLRWSIHPETLLPAKQKRSKGEPSVRLHKSGSARSEGYYKIPMSEKAQYLSSVSRQQTLKQQEEEKQKDGLKHKQQSRENRAMQRRLISSFVNDDFGDLVKFNKLKARKKHLKFSKSGIHDWGLFTCEPIAAEEMVVEYVGDKVRSIIADAREKHYEKTGIGSSYLFRLDAETVIDATKVGNNARFINHSCAPNCYAKIINVENEKKIVIYSKCDIKLNEEITYDYKFPIEDVKIQCLCGTPQCRGTLN